MLIRVSLVPLREIPAVTKARNGMSKKTIAYYQHSSQATTIVTILAIDFHLGRSPTKGKLEETL